MRLKGRRSVALVNHMESAMDDASVSTSLARKLEIYGKKQDEFSGG